MILPLASLPLFWIYLHGCLLDIFCNSFSVACRRGLYLHQSRELLFLEGTVWDLWGFMGMNHLLYCYLSLLKGQMGTTMQIALTMMLVPPFLCLIGHEAPQVQKLQNCISQHCLNSYLVLLSQVFLFSQNRRSIRQYKEYSYYFIPQDQTKQNQICEAQAEQQRACYYSNHKDLS